MKKFTFLFVFAILCQLNLTQAQRLDWKTTLEGVYSFSSPRTADLNGDGVLDFVIGCGVEDYANDIGVAAINGANGEVLWTHAARNQVFGSALFQDINNDGTPDVFMNGRDAIFLALDGATGNTIWEFYADGEPISAFDAGWYNFYNAQWTNDLTNDGLQDILIANGGNKFALLPGDFRPPGNLMLLNAANGAIIAQAEVPDGEETYMSPVLLENPLNNSLDIIFGTGGETEPGSLWRVSFDALLNGDISNATELLSSPDKGFIAPCMLADINGDEVPEIIGSSYDGRTFAIDGNTSEILWLVTLPNSNLGYPETNTTPAIGYFNEDDVPDVFANIGIGLAPVFNKFYQLIIDGASGNVLWKDSLGIFQFNTPAVLDMDYDGRDEILFNINTLSDGNSFQHDLRVFDYGNTDSESLAYGGGFNLNTTPWVGNIHNDKLLDLVHTYNADSLSFLEPNGTVIEKYSLNLHADTHISQGAYMGNNYDGKYNDYTPCTIATDVQQTNPSCSDNGSIVATPEGVSPYSYIWNYQVFEPIPGNFIRTNLATGTYNFTVRDAQNCVSAVDFTLVKAPMEVSVSTTPADEGQNNGTATLLVTNGVAPYEISWDNGALTTELTAGNLAAGTHTVSIADGGACEESLSFEVSEITGINELLQQNVLQLSPVPFARQLNVSIADAQVQIQRIQMFDMLGKQCLLYMPQVYENNVFLDTNALPQAAYVIQIVTNKGVFTQFLLKE
ncbi:MAG: PQQ-binding-like beta-propeller repeat protein [Chitinophagales bacterium]|nr:PQQ-binding-like beta-propeller repeat protein [Bacteroidota bacterium]